MIGALLATICTNILQGGVISFQSQKYKKSIIVLEDPKCSICQKGIERILETLENNVTGAKLVKLNVYSGEGAELYKKIQEEENVNVVPLILLTKDLKDTQTLDDLNRIFAGNGRIGANIIELKEYYALQPFWPVRRYVPGKGEERVKIFADANVNTEFIRQLAYISADNVIIEEKNAEGNYIIHIDGPQNVITALARYIPLATMTSTSIEVPYVHAAIYAVPEVLQDLNRLLQQPAIKIVEVNAIQGDSLIVANIPTDHPEIVVKLLPGARVTPNSVVVDRTTNMFLDVYLGGEQDNEILSQVSRLASAVPNRIAINPHYIVTVSNNSVVSPLGPDGIDRSVLEYCVFLTHGAGSWLQFTLNTRKTCREISECWQNVARELNIDTQKVSNCYASKNNVISFFLKDTAAKGIVRPFVLVNSWYVWTPDKAPLTKIGCRFLVFPPSTLCRGW